ncbi:MAG: ETC complex I subunit [Hyphomonadaceae bacterium]|nr:ETC complex I subunit [Hyphomonadaceae bacterium]
MLAKIYRPSKTAMQSGKAATKKWLLEFEPSTALRSDALMGWTGALETARQVRLAFDDKEAAIAFASEHGIPHQVVETPEPKRHIKSYSENFAFRRREPWSH